MKSQASDESLMRSYQKGEPAAFEELYARYSPNVMTFLRKRIALQEDRDEIFQRVFFKFHRNRHAYDPKYPILQWLYVITKSELLDYLKSQKSKTRLEEEVAQTALSQNPPLPSLNLLEIAGIEDLDPAQREVVSLRVLQDASFSEIALRLKKSESNVRQVLSRALKKLRNRKEEG